jgi:hypothetical protein
MDHGHTAKYDGKEVAVTGTGNAWDTIAIKQVNANTLTEERWKKVRSTIAPGEPWFQRTARR